MLGLGRQKKALAVVDDQIGSPTWARALAISTAELTQNADTRDIDTGIYHLSAGGYASRLDFAKEIFRSAIELSMTEPGWAELAPTTTANYPLPARRPLNAATNKEKVKKAFGIDMPSWETQLRQFIEGRMADAEWRRQAGF